MNNNIYQYNKFKYSSNDCGSGKTYRLIEIVNRSDGRFLIIQNTKRLIEATEAQIPDSHFILDKVNSDTVIRDVHTFLTNPTHRVLIITDKAFMAIKDLSLLKSWKIYADDVVNFHSFSAINSDRKDQIENGIFEDHEVLTGDTYRIANLKTEFTDDIDRAASVLLKSSINHDHFIMNNSYFDKLSTGGYSNEVSQLSLFSYIDLSKYRGLDITFVSNKFEETLLYLSAPDLFEKVSIDNLRERIVPIEERMKVYYFSKKNTLSKNYRIKNKEKVQKVFDWINENITSKYYYTVNSDMKEHFSLNGTFISPDTRGSNEYQDYNTCVWMASMKPTPVESKICEKCFGITKQQVLKAREYESLYQFCNRSALRKYESDSTVSIYVFDEAQALSLSENIKYIDVGIDSNSNGSSNIPLYLTETKKKRLARISLKKYPTRDEFNKWLNNKKNSDLSDRERDHFKNRYNALVLKK